MKSKTLKQLDEEVSKFFKSDENKELKQFLGYTALFSAGALMGKALR